MEKEFDIQEYMTKGVENIVKGAVRATLKDPKESAFMARFALSSKHASDKRKKLEMEGLHVPAFLIASITSSCNLHCAGCYSRANQACTDEAPKEQLTDQEWEKIFAQAKDLGVSFILLAGGEPMVRRDVIRTAGKYPEILFPVFTNGTLFGEEYLELFDRSRNLLPVFSIEGDEAATDKRRGKGVYGRLMRGMGEMKERHLMFGASVTVTKKNLEASMSEEFIKGLDEKGCKAVFFIEYVPVTEESNDLAPDESDREYMKERLRRIRENFPEMVFVSFPGDEKSSGGCVAAGRGFFHINSHGGAEPCPFSPYSDVNVRDTSLREAINSGLFRALRENEVLLEDHKGGCILFEKKAQVEALLSGEESVQTEMGA